MLNFNTSLVVRINSLFPAMGTNIELEMLKVQLINGGNRYGVINPLNRIESLFPAIGGRKWAVITDQNDNTGYHELCGVVEHLAPYNDRRRPKRNKKGQELLKLEKVIRRKFLADNRKRLNEVEERQEAFDQLRIRSVRASEELLQPQKTADLKEQFKQLHGEFSEEWTEVAGISQNEYATRQTCRTMANEILSRWMESFEDDSEG